MCAATGGAVEPTNPDAAPLRVMVWTGHSGPYHDHFANGAVLARALNFSGEFVTHLACDKNEKVPCEAAFTTEGLSKVDVVLVYADTCVASPHRRFLGCNHGQTLFFAMSNSVSVLLLSHWS